MLNKMTLQGRLTRDVELRRTQSGTPVASFTVAWSEKYGESENKLFLPCVAWRATGEMASKWFHNGQEVVVEGQLTSRKWQDKDGNNRESIEMVVDRMHFCGPKQNGDQGYQQPQSYKPAGEPVNVYPQPGEFAEIEDDGDLPF